MEAYICASLDLLTALPADASYSASEDMRCTLLHAALCPLAASVTWLPLQPPSLPASVHTRARAVVPPLLRALSAGGSERVSLALAGLALAAATSGAVADAAGCALEEAITRVREAVGGDLEWDARLPGALSSALASALNALSGPTAADAPCTLGLPCAEGVVRRATLNFVCALIAASPNALFSSDAAVVRDIAARAREDGDEQESDAWAQLADALAL